MKKIRKGKLSNEQRVSIIREYVEDDLSTKQLGRKYNVHANSISKLLKLNNVPMKKPTEIKVQKTEYPNIGNLYKEGFSSSEIDEIYNVSYSLILRILEKIGIDRRNAEDTHRIYPINEDFFDEINTQEKAYILGFIYADGCNILEYGYTSINLNEKDVDILYKILNNIFINCTKDKIKFYKRHKINPKTGIEKIFNHVYLNIHCKYMCNKLNEIGCGPRKSLTATFPKIGEDLLRHFIRGYYDGDGGTFISKSKKSNTLSRIIGTLSFMNDLNKILAEKLDISPYKEVHADGQLIRSSISGRQQVRRFLDWIYEKSTIHLDRKYKIYQQICQDMHDNNMEVKIRIAEPIIINNEDDDDDALYHLLCNDIEEDNEEASSN